MRRIRALPWALLAVASLAGHSAAQTPSTAPIATLEPAGIAAFEQSAMLSRMSMARQDIRAQLKPRHYTTIAAEIGAKVSSIARTEGSAFTAGQVLVSFDCSLQLAQQEKAKAELESTEQTLRANLRLQELNSVGQLELDLSQSAVRKAQAELGAHKAVLDKCQVSAPFSGRVAEQKVREQQFVQAGQPLLDIIDDSVLDLEFLVPSVWLKWLKTGRTFKVQIEETQKTYTARLSHIGARVDPVSQSVKVTATIQSKAPELMAGMSGKVLINPPQGQ